MKHFIKEYPYYSLTVLLVILKVFGIIKWSWWIVTLPIWFWWPALILLGVAMLSYVIIDDKIKKCSKK